MSAERSSKRKESAVTRIIPSVQGLLGLLQFSLVFVSSYLFISIFSYHSLSLCISDSYILYSHGSCQFLFFDEVTNFYIFLTIKNKREVLSPVHLLFSITNLGYYILEQFSIMDISLLYLLLEWFSSSYLLLL